MLKITLVQLPDELENLLSEFLHASFNVRQEAVQAGAEVFRDALVAVSPRSNDTGEHFADCWEIKTKYKDRRYVGNTKTAKGVVHRKTKDGAKGEARTGVPLSNILEYADKSPHKGFIRRCVDSTKPQVYAAMKNKLENVDLSER